MAVSLGEAILKIGADSSSYERKLKRLKGIAKKEMDDAASAVLRGTKNLMLAGAGAIAAGVAAVMKSVMDTARIGGMYDDMSKRTGFTVKALGQLKYAADLTGSSIEEMENGLKRMQRNIYLVGDTSDEAAEKMVDAQKKIKEAIEDARKEYEDFQTAQRRSAGDASRDFISGMDEASRDFAKSKRKPQSRAERAESVAEYNRKTMELAAKYSEERYQAQLKAEKATEEYNKKIKEQQDAWLEANKEAIKAAKAFGDIGLNMAELRKMTPEEQFDAVTGALAEVTDKSKQAALAQEIFGKAGTKLLPMLAEGKAGLARMKQEAIDLGIVMTTEQAAAADAFGDNMDRMKMSILGVKISIGNSLIPIIDNYVKKITEWVMANREVIATKVGEYFQKVKEWLQQAYDVLKPWLDDLGKVAQWIGEHPKLVAGIAIAVVGIATAWKIALAAFAAYKIAVTAVDVVKGLGAEKAAKTAAEIGKAMTQKSGDMVGKAIGEAAGGGAAGKAATAAAKKAAKEAAKKTGGALPGAADEMVASAFPNAAKKGATVGKVAKIGMLGSLGWGLAGGAAAGAGLGVGTLANEHLGIRKAWMSRYNKKDAAADAAISQSEIDALRAKAHGGAAGGAAGGGTNITIQNMQVNADDVVTAKNFQNMLTQKAHAAMP